MVMAAVRMDIPAVVCSGGPMMSGLVDGEETSLSKMFEAVGARKADLIDDEQLEEFEQNTCPDVYKRQSLLFLIRIIERIEFPSVPCAAD